MKLLFDKSGIESTEVALILAVVVLVAYGAYKFLGESIRNIVQNVANMLGG